MIGGALAALTIWAVTLQTWSGSSQVAVNVVDQGGVVDDRLPRASGLELGRDAGAMDDRNEVRLPPRSITGSRFPANLKFEKTMIRQGRISFDQAVRMLKGNYFDSYIRDVQWQSQRDLEAARMTELYVQTVEKLFGDDRLVSLDELGCGLSICVGSITTYGFEGEQQYTRLHQALAPGESTPAYSMIEVPLGEEGGIVQHRFVFAADQDMTSIGDRKLP